MKKNITHIFKDTNDWFKANLLTLNLDKTYFIHFMSKNSQVMDMHIIHDSNKLAKATNARFLRLIIDNMLSWEGQVDWLMTKLSSACYAVKTIKPYMSLCNDL
jgi:hypothetical protein